MGRDDIRCSLLEYPIMVSSMKTTSIAEYEITSLGQVFTPPPIVEVMCALVQNTGRVLEPACGNGVFLERFPEAFGIEVDPRHAPPQAEVMNFFELATDELFDTIIGNPPYVRNQDISPGTRRLASQTILDKRANLYLLFIEKCLAHLEPTGELIFITPRDFLKSTSAVPLNRLMYREGTVTDFIDLGDQRIFEDATPNCAIWRFEKGNFSRQTNYAEQVSLNRHGASTPICWQRRHFMENNGQLSFSRGHYPVRFTDIATVKVGAVSGADDLYTSEAFGNRDFVCSTTLSDGKTRKMIWCGPADPPPEVLVAQKERLISRRIRKFREENWWHWGRTHFQSENPRIYVNTKTRRSQPFFVHDCPDYDGSVLAVFPHDATIDAHLLAEALNRVDWADLGFVCDGRFLFTQRSLEQTCLPENFEKFVSKKSF